jgi:bleomycin hydrolase
MALVPPVKFGSEPHRLVQNALASARIDNIATDSSKPVQRYFKHTLDPHQIPVLNQGKSGRCWIFCFNNMIRRRIIKQYNMAITFSFSNKFIHFYDRLERCNAFLEVLFFIMRKGGGESPTSLYVTSLREQYLSDGGVWDTFSNIIQKYGLVPEHAYPDNKQSTNTDEMNRILSETILIHNQEIYTIARTCGANTQKNFDKLKTRILKSCYTILETFLGTPPNKVVWQYPNAKDKLVGAGGKEMSPLDLYVKYVRPHIDVSKFVTLINDPRKPYNQMYTTEMSHAVLPEHNKVPLDKLASTHFFNVPNEVLCDLVFKSIRANVAVPFAADIHQYTRAKESRLDMNLIYADVIDNFKQASKKRLYDNLVSQPNHAMLIVAANGIEGEWQVENSWGTMNSDHPYLTMTKDWFDHFVGEIVVHRKVLPSNMKRTYDKFRAHAPEHYKYYKLWDVFGSLA